MADATLDPQTQNAISSAQAAIAAAEAAEKDTDEFLARLDQELEEVKASREAYMEELKDEATSIVQKMDEDTLQFLSDIADMPANSGGS